MCTRLMPAGGFFAGLVAGEGCFQIHENDGGQNWACPFVLSMRADERALVGVRAR